MKNLIVRLSKNFMLATALLAASISYASQFVRSADAPIVQPGAPGNPIQILDAKTAIAIANSSYSYADVVFMQQMIVHHNQALVMANLAAERTNNEEVLALASRIKVTQDDEMIFMSKWLTDRLEAAPNPQDPNSHKTHHSMAGMATSEQLMKLSDSKSVAFDQIFLTLMINHHDGAIKMVDHLRDQSGSAYDPVMDEFVSDVANDQAVEIERMNTLLVGLSNDPRASLASGLFDAEEAVLNMLLVESQYKPPGFFDPKNPADRGAESVKKDDESSDEDDPTTTIAAANSRRYPMLSFSNTDMAFSDNLLIAGSYHGFNIYKLDKAGLPSLASSVVCPGGQGDVSVVGNLLIMSVEQTRGRLDCGLQGVSEDISSERFRGIRIFDISDFTRPIQVGAVQTCRGSHTHSVVAGPTADGKILVYNSGTSSVREEEELEGCVDGSPGDNRTALFRIDIIEIPINDPSKSRIIDSPTVFANSDTGVIAGLWRGGDHGDDTQDTYRTDQCHDITVFPTANLAAGACSGNGILFDISDPRKPMRIDDVTDTGFAYWHSATFNNDGSKILFTDEWGGGGRARCRAWDPKNWGADAIYDIIEGKLQFKSNYKIPAPQLETENCVAHNGSIIPVPGRDIFIQAWYQGGISVIDFTDSANPFEIAYFDRGPIHETELVTGGFWSVYYYEGTIYGTEITRGLDVFKLLPSEFLSKNEIAAAKLAYPEIGPKRLFNPQQQVPMKWPASPAVARSYIDQLVRTDSLNTDDIKSLERLLKQVKSTTKNEKSSDLVLELLRMSQSINRQDDDVRTQKRLDSLNMTLKEMASDLSS
jgi:uncharacterized protein (DUF305 family)